MYSATPSLPLLVLIKHLCQWLIYPASLLLPPPWAFQILVCTLIDMNTREHREHAWGVYTAVKVRGIELFLLASKKTDCSVDVDSP